MPSRKAEFWVKQVKAPEGYDLYKLTKTFTARPGAPVTVTITNAKAATMPKPTRKPTDKPTDTPSRLTDKPTESASGGLKTNPTAADSLIIPSADGMDSTSPETPAGSLAHTSADATPWVNRLSTAATFGRQQGTVTPPGVVPARVLGRQRMVQRRCASWRRRPPTRRTASFKLFGAWWTFLAFVVIIRGSRPGCGSRAGA